MNTINLIADFVAMPDPARTTWQIVVLRFAAFIILVLVSIVVGHWTGLSISIGWMFGYAWGALTVYGIMRPHLRT